MDTIDDKALQVLMASELGRAAMLTVIEVCRTHVEHRRAWWTDIRDALDYLDMARTFIRELAKEEGQMLVHRFFGSENLRGYFCFPKNDYQARRYRWIPAYVLIFVGIGRLCISCDRRSQYPRIEWLRIRKAECHCGANDHNLVHLSSCMETWMQFRVRRVLRRWGAWFLHQMRGKR